jgi:Flp pilus assembly protein TadD
VTGTISRALRQLVVTFTVSFTLAVSAAAARAQDAKPLRKSELVRLLSGGTYAQGEIATIVARSCLAFLPTARDREDLRRLGAARPVLDAVDRCARVLAPPPPPSPTARIATAGEVTARAGDSVRVLARAILDGANDPGVSLVMMEGTGRTERNVADAVTRDDGEATFFVHAGRVAGERIFRVRRATQRSGGTEVTLLVRPADPATVIAVPGTATIPPAGDSTITLLLLPRDRFGNALPDLELSLHRRGAPAADTLLSIRTASTGLARVSLRTASLREKDELLVLAGGAELGAIPVVRGRFAERQPAQLTVRASRMLADAEEGMIRGNHASALALYDRLLALYPREPEALLGRGQALAGLGRYAEAQLALLELIQMEPDNAAAITQLATVYLETERYAEASELYLLALHTDRRQSLAARGYATTALRRGHVALAVRLFRNALEMFPDDAELLVGLAGALVAAERSAEALPLYRRALELEPMLESARRGLEELEGR